MIQRRSFAFAIAAIAAGGATTALCFGDAFGLARSPAGSADAIVAPPFGATSRPLKALHDAGPWLDAIPNGPASLRGKVVVVNFWTYSCINALRALPYLRAWRERYKARLAELERWRTLSISTDFPG